MKIVRCADADVICEKPLVLNPWNISSLQELETESGKKVYNILQLRLHPTIIALREQVLSGPKDKIYDVDLSFVSRIRYAGTLRLEPASPISEGVLETRDLASIRALAIDADIDGEPVDDWGLTLCRSSLSFFVSDFKKETLSFKLSLAFLRRANNASSSSFVLVTRDGAEAGGGMIALCADCSGVQSRRDEDRRAGGDVCGDSWKDSEPGRLVPRGPVEESN